MRPRTATGSETGSRPNTLTVPVCARHNPRRCLISVDLPAPFSPTRPNTQPGVTTTDTSVRAFVPPKLRDRCATAITGSVGRESRSWSSRTTFPRLSSPPEREFVLHEPANVVFSKFERLKAIQGRSHDRFGLSHDV